MTLLVRENAMPTEPRPVALSSREAFRSTLLEAAQQDPRIICLDADMGGLEAFREALPAQYVDVGISEANMISMAAGLARVGLLPVAHTMASFAASRANEQVKLDIARNDLPVIVAASHGGVSGGHLGPTHHALEDIALLRTLPGLTILVPSDAIETGKALQAALALGSPVYLRFGRKATPLHHRSDYTFRLGKAETITEGDDVAIFASGPSALAFAKQAGEILRANGISALVMNFHTIKPLDTESIAHVSSKVGRIVTVEEHSVIGGLGSSVAEFTATNIPCRLRMVGAVDYFSIPCGNEDYLLDALSINVKSILAAARSML